MSPMGVTDDRNDPALTHGVDDEPTPMADKYLVLSEEEIAKGFVRPVRRSYIHLGVAGPEHPLRELTPTEHERYDDVGYVRFEEYPPDSHGSALGKFWTQAQLDAVKTCGAVTTMGTAIAETYAAEPRFYGATFCVACQMHRPVGPDGEFIWDDGSGQKVGT